MVRFRDDCLLNIEDIPMPAVIGSFRVMRECNQAFCDLYKFSRGQLIGSSFRMIYLDNSDYVRSGIMWKTHLDKDLEYVDERIMLKSDGSKFWCQVRGKALDKNHPVSLAIWVVQPLQRPVTPDGPDLTLRQRQILALVVQGKNNLEIAGEIGISSRTAEAHRARIMRKVGVRNSAELVAWFVGSRESTLLYR